MFGVGVRAAPVLHEEQPKPFLGWPEVRLLRVERQQHLVVCDLLVEPGDDAVEDLLAADRVVEVRYILRCRHESILPSARSDL